MQVGSLPASEAHAGKEVVLSGLPFAFLHVKKKKLPHQETKHGHSAGGIPRCASELVWRTARRTESMAEPATTAGRDISRPSGPYNQDGAMGHNNAQNPVGKKIFSVFENRCLWIQTKTTTKQKQLQQNRSACHPSSRLCSSNPQERLGHSWKLLEKTRELPKGQGF